MFFRNVMLTLGGLFVVAGIVLMILFFGQVRNAPAVVETPVVVPQKQAMLVAARKIPRGTKLKEEDFKDAAPGEVHVGSLRRGEEKQFLDTISHRDIAEGEPLMPDDFSKHCDKLFVEQGYRAVSIAVDAAQSVAGLAVKGDYVDVLLTQNFDDKVTTDPGRKWAGETVLRDVQVLATDQSLCPPSGIPSNVGAAAASAHMPQTVTLQLKERQAEVLMVAGKLGAFQLAVRPHESADTARPEEHNIKPVWASDVSPALREIVAPPLATATPALSRGPPPPSPCPPATGSTLDQNVRCAPSSYFRSPAVINSGAPAVINSESVADERPEADCSVARAQAEMLRTKIALGEQLIGRAPSNMQNVLEAKYNLWRTEAERLESCKRAIR
jgi:pilus assembly protein CpaB